MKLKLFLSILFIALITSGCAYNATAVNKHLTKAQADKLNGIMLTVLNIPHRRLPLQNSKLSL